jgi:hypothetical protein
MENKINRQFKLEGYSRRFGVATKKEPQKVIDLGNVELLAWYFLDDKGIRHYYGNPEHIFQLRLTDKDLVFLKKERIDAGV